jgi:hypothetical protein
MLGIRRVTTDTHDIVTLPFGLSVVLTWAEREGRTDDTFVFDPVEMVAWGPFESDDEAERFIESDKYLASWCVVTTGEAMRRHLVTAYPPAAYHGTWPKES